MDYRFLYSILPRFVRRVHQTSEWTMPRCVLLNLSFACLYFFAIFCRTLITFLTKVLVSFSFLAFAPSHRRMALAALSDRCSGETSLIPEYEDHKKCYGVLESCMFDYSAVSGEYENSCIASGGQFYETNTTYRCSALVDGTLKNFEYLHLNDPYCYAASCTPAEGKEFFETVIYPIYELPQFTDNLTRYDCEVSGTGTSSGNVFFAGSQAAMALLWLFCTVYCWR